MRSTRNVVVVSAAIAAAVAGSSATAAPNVQVTLGVYRFHEAVKIAECPVSVEVQSDGANLLEAAKQKGCISSYKLRTFPGFGRFVECINDICQTPDETLNAVYWAMSENGAYTDYGIDGFRAAQGDKLAFTWTSWVIPQ